MAALRFARSKGQFRQTQETETISCQFGKKPPAGFEFTQAFVVRCKKTLKKRRACANFTSHDDTAMSKTLMRMTLASRNMFRLFVLVAILAFVGLAPGVAADRETVEIVTKSGVQIFDVEVVRTESERAKGLMYRTELPDGRGMLFDFNVDQNVSMWMKNTLISLDMIFIRADGRILRIAENTQTQSETIISSGGPVRGVLEVIAGTTRKQGIAAGDRVAHPMFRK